MQKKDTVISFLLYSLIFLFLLTITFSIITITFFAMHHLISNNTINIIFSLLFSFIPIYLMYLVYSHKVSDKKEFLFKVLTSMYFIIFSFLSFYFNVCNEILVSITIALAIGVAVWNSFSIN